MIVVSGASPSTSSRSISGRDWWSAGSIHKAGQRPRPWGSRIRASTVPYVKASLASVLSADGPVVTIPERKSYGLPSVPLTGCCAAVSRSVPSATLTCPGAYHSSSLFELMVHPPSAHQWQVFQVAVFSFGASKSSSRTARPGVALRP